MPTPEEVKDELIATDEEFRQMWEEHQNHERTLDELNASPEPSEEDEVVAKGIKVQKLHLKDRMEAIIRQHL